MIEIETIRLVAAVLMSLILCAMIFYRSGKRDGYNEGFHDALEEIHTILREASNQIEKDGE